MILEHSEEWLIKQASSYGVKVCPTSLYVVNNYSDRPIIKLGFSSLSHEEIQLGVQLLKKPGHKHNKGAKTSIRLLDYMGPSRETAATVHIYQSETQHQLTDKQK